MSLKNKFFKVYESEKKIFELKIIPRPSDFFSSALKDFKSHNFTKVSISSLKFVILIF